MSPIILAEQYHNLEQIRSVLVVEDARGKRAINLDRNIYSVGRESRNSIVIYSPLVSRHHATLLKITNSDTNSYTFQIIDGDLQGNRSTNGLTINGKTCLSEGLKHKDLVVLGGKVKLWYLKVDSHLSEKEILDHYGFDDESIFSTDSIDPFETLVPAAIEAKPLSEGALLRLASFPELLPIPIIELDLSGKITYLNPASILHFPELQQQKVNHPVTAGLLSAVDDEDKYVFIREVVVGHDIFEQSIHYLQESRLIRSYLVNITQRKQAEKMLKRINEDLENQVEKRTIELRQTIEQLQAEMEERQQAEATIRYQALHDLLTNLPNRTLFNDRLKAALSHAERNGSLMAVMFLDLDRFKTINDTLGHATGDELLQGFAERLKNCLRSEDTVARWGGDEFTVLLPHISSTEDVAHIAQRILDSLKPAFYLEANGKGTVPLHISSSIGIAVYPKHGEDADTLLINSDSALYRAKKYGRNNYRFYIPEMNSQASELLQLENRLHQALDREEFIIYYQPQININTLTITGMEALVRWNHPELGLVSPAQFIPLAEENGLINPIGQWVLRTACYQNQTWQEAGFSGLRVAVNLSPRQFQEPTLGAFVQEILLETGLAPNMLELEITESTVMQNVDFAIAMLNELEKMGVHISMDDFGTGYSSLSNLKKFPFHTLKIDRSFIRDLTSNPQDSAIISAVLALGRGLNLRVIAEGVETLEQVELLQGFQCEEMQGYLFSQPLSDREATKMLEKYWGQGLNTYSNPDAERSIRSIASALALEVT